jgi:hypothetical protein
MILLALNVDSTAIASQEATASSRVRSESSWITEAIAEGNDTSPTFQGLITAINATDGMVYVQEGQCRPSVRACLHLSVGIAGPYRFLRILIGPGSVPGCEFIGVLGHELQHALEVLSNPRIRNWRQMYSFFDLNGKTIYDTFETDAAISVEMQVERETCNRP